MTLSGRLRKMQRTPSHSLTRCELEVMQVVWARGAVTVQDVVDALERSLAYTTVMTTLKILADKAVLRRTKQGRAHVYEAEVTRDEVCQSMTRELTVRLFRGSAKSLVLNLLGHEKLSASDIDELKSAIASLEEST